MELPGYLPAQRSAHDSSTNNGSIGVPNSQAQWDVRAGSNSSKKERLDKFLDHLLVPDVDK
jgi:hypothetical protein